MTPEEASRVTEWVSGNIFLRPMRFAKAGDVVKGHAHNFDHTTFVTRGAVRIERLTDLGEVQDSVDKAAEDTFNWVLIRAGVIHRITALRDDSLANCVYAHRDPQGEVVAVHEGWTPAYE